MLYIASDLDMKKAIVERNLVVILFILVLVVFSFAERDSKKLERIYKTSAVKRTGAKQILTFISALNDDFETYKVDQE